MTHEQIFGILCFIEEDKGDRLHVADTTDTISLSSPIRQERSVLLGLQIYRWSIDHWTKLPSIINGLADSIIFIGLSGLNVILFN